MIIRKIFLTFKDLQNPENMKKVQYYLNLLLLLGVLSVFISYTGCNSDDDGDPVINPLIGIWTISDVNLVTELGDMSVKEFLMEVGGLSDLDATGYTILFESLLESTFNGTIEFKDDNTYKSNIAGEMEEGTWRLNSDGDELTLNSGTSDETVVNIITLNENTLKLSLNTSELANIDDESLIPDLDISIAVEMTLTK
jgi:hypothetical protein